MLPWFRGVRFVVSLQILFRLDRQHTYSPLSNSFPLPFLIRSQYSSLFSMSSHESTRMSRFEESTRIWMQYLLTWSRFSSNSLSLWVRERNEEYIFKEQRILFSRNMIKLPLTSMRIYTYVYPGSMTLCCLVSLPAHAHILTVSRSEEKSRSTNVGYVC